MTSPFVLNYCLMRQLRLTVAILALATPAVNAATTPFTVKDWTFQNYDSGVGEAWTRDNSGALLGIHCTPAGCRSYLAPQPACDEGTRGRVELNFVGGQTLAEATCIELGEHASQQPAVFVFDDPDMPFLGHHAVGVALPVAHEEFTTYRFSLEGAKEARWAAQGYAWIRDGKEPGSPEAFAYRAVFAGDRLWLLNRNGTLSSRAQGSQQPVGPESFEPVLDLWVSDGAPMVIAGAGSGGAAWTLRRFSHGAWATEASIPTRGDALLAAAKSEHGTVLLTSRRLLEIRGSDQTSVQLERPEELRGGAVASILATPSAVLVGLDAGEFGGGLRSIDRRTGLISTIASKEPGCGGLLNTACDVVYGMAIEPWNPGCAAVAVGNMHMGAHGSIVEVCGEAIHAFFPKPDPDGTPPAEHGKRGSARTECAPFVSLLSKDQALWATCPTGIFRFGERGAVEETPLPAFTRVGDDLIVGYDLPGLVFRLIQVTADPQDPSGRLPLLVPR